MTTFLCCFLKSALLQPVLCVNNHTHSLYKTFFGLRKLIQMPHFSDEDGESQRGKQLSQSPTIGLQQISESSLMFPPITPIWPRTEMCVQVTKSVSPKSSY